MRVHRRMLGEGGLMAACMAQGRQCDRRTFYLPNLPDPDRQPAAMLCRLTESLSPPPPSHKGSMSIVPPFTSAAAVVRLRVPENFPLGLHGRRGRTDCEGAQGERTRRMTDCAWSLFAVENTACSCVNTEHAPCKT